MGKNKWFFETEGSNKQQGEFSKKSGKPQAGKGNFTPSTYVLDSPENMPLPKLIRLVWLRLRRSWVALHFQLNRWSFGVFRKKTILQLGFLIGIGYFMLGPDGEESAAITAGNSTKQNWARETTLDVAIHDEPKPIPSSPKKASKKNEAAPVSAEELLREQSEDYIQRFAKTAVGEMDKFGIPASISLAQGLVESRAGTSKLAVENNNHFGLKCFSRQCGKGHCSNYTDDTHKDFFRKFVKPWESWRAHSELLASGRYTKLKKHGKNYKAWARGLQSAGYATDRKYADKLIGIIERYKLYQYDR